MPLQVVHQTPLAPFTTLELGGSADVATIEEPAHLHEALALAQQSNLPVTVLGGGSNVIVPDAGVRGLVLLMRTRGREAYRQSDGRIDLRVAAGEPWDDLVAWTVAQNWQGLECLSGIPGLVGATPIQNVGAYGCDVAETITRVELTHVASRRLETWSAERFAFAYRDSALKRQPGQWVVTAVHFQLRADTPPVVRYPELARALAGVQAPSLHEVRTAVMALRRSKSMVLELTDANRRSVGSFFTNPLVSADRAAVAQKVAQQRGLSLPHWPQPDGRVKLAAGWLIEQAGITKGLRRGQVGVSSRHALALVHHGGGTTAALLALAGEVQAAVRSVFGVSLEREAVLLGDQPGSQATGRRRQHTGRLRRR